VGPWLPFLSVVQTSSFNSFASRLAADNPPPDQRPTRRQKRETIRHPALASHSKNGLRLAFPPCTHTWAPFPAPTFPPVQGDAYHWHHQRKIWGSGWTYTQDGRAPPRKSTLSLVFSARHLLLLPSLSCFAPRTVHHHSRSLALLLFKG
jgi:hypothetical protein